MFNEEHAKKLDQISIHVSQKAISEVLQDILWKNGLTWKFENDIIMVSTRDAQVQEEPIKVHGVVIDEKGDSIPGVTVQIKGMSLGTSTNHKGMFSLSIPREIENLTLIFSFIGMESKEIKDIQFGTLEDALYYALTGGIKYYDQNYFKIQI